MKQICIIMVGLCFGCHDQNRKPSDGQSPPNLAKVTARPSTAAELIFSGGDGSTYEQAVVIKVAKNEDARVRAAKMA